MIEIDVKERKLNIIGVNGVHKTPEEIDEILKKRRKNWKPRTPKYNKGVMGLFTRHAVINIETDIIRRVPEGARLFGVKVLTQRCEI